VAGTPDSVKGLDRAGLASFLAQHYVPANTVVSVAGDVQHDQVVDLLERLLGDWLPSATPGFVAAPVNGVGPRVALVSKKVEQTHLALHLPGLARDNNDRFVLGLLNVILGEGMSSRLFLEIRERLGLAYAVDSYTSYLADTGVTGIYAAVAPERALEALAAILAQLQRLREEPVDAAALRSAKEFVKGRLLLGMEDTMSVAGWLGRQEAASGEQLTVEQIVARMDQISASELLRMANLIFQAGRSQLAIVGPHKKREAARFKELLLDGPLAFQA
jgi:predicted Zn-dependent peptidase